MPLATYADLQAEIAGWLRRGDLTAEIPTFIALAEATMNRELRTSLQLARQAYTIAGEFTDKPAGLRTMRSLRLVSGSGRTLIELTPEQMARRKSGAAPVAGEPQAFTALGPQLEFWPAPDRAYGAVMEFQAGFAPLGDAAPTNWILADHPDAYLYGALAGASGYLKQDERASGFDQVFRRALDEIQDALRTLYDRTLRGDPALVTRTQNRALDFMTGDC